MQEPTTMEEVQKKTNRIQKHKYNWQERLLPNVVYEDVKCIQKIESAVRLTGVQDISSVTVDHPRLRTDPGNRIWLCLPRNAIAQRKLAQLKDIDRQPDNLQEIAKRADMSKTDPQALLEVTFSNYRIIAVKNVSEFDANYFKKQMDDSQISEVIEKYR